MKLALIDINTSGIRPNRDELLSLTIYILNGSKANQCWQRSIINKSRHARNMSTNLATAACTEEMATPFTDIAHELHALIEDSILLGHAIDFTYAILKNHFKQVGISYRSTTVEMRQLISHLNCNDDLLPEKYFSPTTNFHRDHTKMPIECAESFIMKVIEHIGEKKFTETLKHLSYPSSMPRNLLTKLSSIPNTPGVYLFYGEDSSIPLYIGKSIHLNKRIRSHFYAFHQNTKEFRLFQNVNRIEYKETAGELGALLLESRLIKSLKPIHNRRLRRTKSLWGIKLEKHQSYHQLSITSLRNATSNDLLYSGYSSMRQAKNALQAIIKQYRLCPKLCGLEHSQKACFYYQLHRCMGACIGLESFEKYNERLLMALSNISISQWPYEHSIAIEEYCPANGLRDFIIIDRWQYIETVTNLEQYNGLGLKKNVAQCRDEKKILHQYLKAQGEQLKIHCMKK